MTEETTSIHVYVVDANNQPIAVMECEQVLRQGLKHRSVLLLLRDARGRLVLRRRPTTHPVYPGRWDIAGSGHVPVDMAAEDAALACLPAVTCALEVVHMRTLDASARTGNAFADIFVARLNDTQSAALLRDRAYLAVDPDELDALATTHPDLFTPALMTVWADRIAFAPN